jgi:Protein of unknown function (DUF1759)
LCDIPKATIKHFQATRENYKNTITIFRGRFEDPIWAGTELFIKLFAMSNQIQDDHTDFLRVWDLVREVNHNLDKLSRDYKKRDSFITAVIYLKLPKNILMNHHHFVKKEERFELETMLKFLEFQAECKLISGKMKIN